MKKKSKFSCLLAVLFLMFICTFSVYAEEGTIEVIREETSDQVVYNVGLTENSGVQAGDYVLYYDSEQLSFVSVKSCQVGEEGRTLIATNHVIDEHCVRISFASMDEIPNATTLVKVTFDVMSSQGSDSEKQPIDETKPVIGIIVTNQTSPERESMSSHVIADNTVTVLDSETTLISNDYSNIESSSEVSIDKNDTMTAMSSSNYSSWVWIAGIVVFMILIIVIVILLIKKRKIHLNAGNRERGDLSNYDVISFSENSSEERQIKGEMSNES